MSASQISQIETGRRADPGFSTVLRLAKALEVSMDALAGLKEPRAHQPRMSRPSKAALERAHRQLEDVTKRIAEVLENES
jgi:transcriptional regulator with XRE-family HTH domain